MKLAQKDDVSFPEALRQILQRNYPVYQSLKMKLVNYHALAEHVQPEVTRLTGKKPTINSLVVAIKRFSDSLDGLEKPVVENILGNTRISLTSGIVDLTIKAPRSEFSRIVKEIADMERSLSEFPHMFPLASSIKLIMPEEDYEKVKMKLEGFEIVGPVIHAAKLVLRMPLTSEMKPGIASYLTELMYRNGVNIHDAFLGYGDIIMVVDDRDGPEAYDILQREVNTPPVKA